MTLCIAAICRQENQLVLGTDLMLSTDWMSSDTQTLKAEPLAPRNRWVMMFAGDPTVRSQVAETAEAILAKQESDELPNVVAACLEAFRAALKVKIESELLGSYGIDRDSFVKRGRRYFGESEFSRLIAEMGTISLETDFLVAGFDSNTRPHLFSITSPGVVAQHYGLGFYAIGTGNLMALGSLSTTFDTDLPLNDLIYRVCEAKFLGEKALGVGKKTFVLTMAPDGTYQRLKPENVEPIRAIWEQVGKPPIPQAARDAIEQRLIGLVWKDRPIPC